MHISELAVMWDSVGRFGSVFFFFNDTATTEIYTLSLHDALPIWLTIDKLFAHNLGLGWIYKSQDKNINDQINSFWLLT